jgi:hypothetical protein
MGETNLPQPGPSEAASARERTFAPTPVCPAQPITPERIVSFERDSIQTLTTRTVSTRTVIAQRRISTRSVYIRPFSGKSLALFALAIIILLLICAWAKATPALAVLPASFGENGTGAGEFVEPSGIAVDQESGDVYVADTGNNRIDEFGPEGEFLLAFGWGVADGKTEALQTCTATCFAGLPGSGAGQFNGVEGIAVDSSLGFSHGDVYVADTRNDRIEKFGPNGEFLLQFGSEGTGPGQFQALTKRAVAVSSTTGAVYVADNGRVQHFSETGAVQTPALVFPGAGPSQNLAVDSTGDIYLKSEELPGVRKYDSTGKELGKPRDEAGYGTAKSIAIGPANELFVNEFAFTLSHHILAFNAEGEQSSSFDAGVSAQDGERGIAYSEYTKAIYVLTAEDGVRVVTPPPLGPLVLSGSEKVTEIEPTGVKLEATANPEGTSATGCRFEYGPTAAYGRQTAEEALKGGGSAFEDQPLGPTTVTGLVPNTVYHFRVVCENAAKEVADGPDQTVTTLPAVSIDSTSVSEVDDQSATLEAELNPHGVASEYHFEYDTTPYVEGQSEHGTKVPIPDASAGSGSEPTPVSRQVQGLSTATVYYYRVVAHNTLGTSVGPGHTFTTQSSASTLPDGRQWELVSPPNKHGAPIEPTEEYGGFLEAAAEGGKLTYFAIGPLGEQSKASRSPENSQWLSTRSSTGWATEDITAPEEEPTPINVPFQSAYRLFSEDLSAGILVPNDITPLSTEATGPTPYRREADGRFVPLVTAANVPAGTEFPDNRGTLAYVEAATPDLSHVLLSSSQVLAAGFKEGFTGGPQSLYELFDGKLQLVSIAPNNEPVAETGHSSQAGSSGNVRGVISQDGDRVFFSAEGELLMRDMRLKRTLQIDHAAAGASGESGGGIFQAANSEGTRVFFTDASRLTPDSTARPSRPDLYMCAVEVNENTPSCDLTDLSVDVNKGESANVSGQISAVDSTGEHVYFAAGGVLTHSPSSDGERAVPSGTCAVTCNLYEYEAATASNHLVAILSAEDRNDWELHLADLSSRTSPDGTFFAFMSDRELTGYDNRDVVSGAADEEVYLFDAHTASLRCVSCDPSGARPHGVFDPATFPGLLVDHKRNWAGRWLAGVIPGWTTTASAGIEATQQPRYLADGGRLFFDSPSDLVSQAKNNVDDVYEYEPIGGGDAPADDTCTASSAVYHSALDGCVSLISSGTASEESAFLDASETGDEVYFLTSAELSPLDTDTANDVYDAHACTDASPCAQLPSSTAPCEGDACQNLVAPPNEPTPGSLGYRGPGNAPPAPATTASKVKVKPTHVQLLAVALKSCRKKKQKQRRLACERQARKKYAPVKTKVKKTAHGRRGK